MRPATWFFVGALLLLVARIAKGASVQFKPGVDLALRPEMARALPDIEQAHLDVGITRGAYITSGKDGVHGPDSLHALGLAVDMRTHDLEQSVIDALAAQLKLRLNDAMSLNRPYQIIIEPNASAPNASSHIHVEYQPYPGYRG